MKKHYGNLVETVVRRKVRSISGFAKLVNMNRRSIYNWFKQEDLKQEIIFRIGYAIDHDFSRECPELFISHDFIKITAHESAYQDIRRENKVDDFWKNKYLHLLEEYTQLLSENARNRLG